MAFVRNMPEPAGEAAPAGVREAAKAIVREWFNWADRGMYIANGMIDRKALDRLEAAIATGMVSSQAPLREALDAMAREAAKARRKPKGEAA